MATPDTNHLYEKTIKLEYNASTTIVSTMEKFTNTYLCDSDLAGKYHQNHELKKENKLWLMIVLHNLSIFFYSMFSKYLGGLI